MFYWFWRYLCLFHLYFDLTLRAEVPFRLSMFTESYRFCWTAFCSYLAVRTAKVLKARTKSRSAKVRLCENKETKRNLCSQGTLGTIVVYRLTNYVISYKVICRLVIVSIIIIIINVVHYKLRNSFPNTRGGLRNFWGFWFTSLRKKILVKDVESWTTPNDHFNAWQPSHEAIRLVGTFFCVIFKQCVIGVSKTIIILL